LLRALPADTSAAARVRGYLVSQLSRGEIANSSLAQAAIALRLPERSLQRRLAAEGTSYQAMLDEVRYGAALEYLAEPRTALAEIAYLLGFGDEGAFHRAFQRWAGITPGEQRRRRA
jgi:AraC-like DNA-binding protein